MSNTRKLKNNGAKIDSAKPEPKTAPAKSITFKAATSVPLAAKTGPVQSAPVTMSSAPISGRPVPAATAASSVSPVPIVAQKPAPAAPKIQSPSPKPSPATPQASNLGHVSLELVKPGAKHVCVAGSFNGWKPEKTPLVQKGNGRWVGDVEVNPGRYEYLFVVDGQWLPDPNAKESVQNPFGGRNSILTVSA